MLRGLVATDANTEANSECELDDDEDKLDEETDEQDTVLTTVEDSDAEVLDTNQDGTNDVSSTGEKIDWLVGCCWLHISKSEQDSHEQADEPIVQFRVAECIKDREQNQTRSAGNGEED